MNPDHALSPPFPKSATWSHVEPRVARATALLLTFVAVSALTRGVSFGVDILNPDEASYMVGARQWLAGYWPYISFADNKPPLIYAYYALADLLIGHGMLGVRLLTNLVTVPLTAFAASAYFGHDKRGRVAALLFLIYSAAYVGSDMLATNCELVMALPLSWALVCVRNPTEARDPRRVFAAGLLVGIATLVKYQAMLWLPAIALGVALEGLPAALRGARRAPLVALFIGVAMPIAAATLVFWAAGGLREFIYWNVTHNLSYLMNPTSAGEAAVRIVKRLLPFIAVTLPLWIAAARRASAGSTAYDTRLVAGLIAGSAVAAFLGLRLFPHYFVQLFVPLAIGAAPFVARLMTRPLGLAGALVIAFSVTASAGFTAVNAAKYLGQAAPDADWELLQRINLRLQQDECFADGSLFVWGSAPLLYYDSGLRLGTRFFFPEYPLVAHFSGNPAATPRRVGHRLVGGGRLWKWLINDLTRNKPTYIVDTAPAALSGWEYFPLGNYPWLNHFVSHHYEPLATVDGVNIYRRRGCSL